MVARTHLEEAAPAKRRRRRLQHCLCSRWRLSRTEEVESLAAVAAMELASAVQAVASVAG
eukprot:7389729-Prymnesium_polylepis.2